MIIELLRLLGYGIVIGFPIGMTIGPVAVLCLQQSMMDSWLMGATVGLGASLVHLLFAAIATYSVTFVESFFITYGGWIQLAAAITILFVAWRVSLGQFSFDRSNHKKIGYFTAFFSMLLINFSSIVSISSYATAMGLLAIFIHNGAHVLFFLTGIFLGNIAWWLGLTTVSHYLAPYIAPRYLRWVNPIAATFLALLGIITLINAFFTLSS